MSDDFDMREVLDDPAFTDQFMVIRETEVVDDHGRVTDKIKTQTIAFGSVQPAGGMTLTIMPDLARVPGIIEIWTDFNLQSETNTNAPDLVLWEGDHYTVITVQPWQNWGPGFTHATCQRREMTGSTNPL